MAELVLKQYLRNVHSAVIVRIMEQVVKILVGFYKITPETLQG